MPTYGYRCQACGVEFDVVQRMSDPAEAACPQCAGAGKRLFYPGGITFRGQGFYKTDSRGGANGASTPDASKPDAKPATDSKPAPTTTPSTAPSASTSTPTTPAP